MTLALVAVNGLCIRPMFNQRLGWMNAQEAADLCALLQPRYAVLMHYAFTGGIVSDHLLLKYTGTAPEFISSSRRPDSARQRLTR